MSHLQILRFGIQSLDRLIGRKGFNDDQVYGIDLSKPTEPKHQLQADTNQAVASSICLAGPDGTGKSVLSLHLASQYVADCLAESAASDHHSCPKILYISTDLTFNMALKGWNHFALATPFKRREPLVELRNGRPQPQQLQVEVNLKPYLPLGDSNSEQSVVRYLEDYSPGLNDGVLKGEVCFVDLSSSTAGDDWGFVHRLLSSLETPVLATDPRHLVLLDAVEGFETLVGDLNAFGEESSRRSRIAQVMRLVAGKCHVLLVVEEGREQRFPEEFVTDVVIRLRNVATSRYLRRTVEIEKARGQSHRRGQHPYVIRDGRGSTTGTQPNADDPEVPGHGTGERRQSYVHVFPSLDYNSREIMISRRSPSESDDQATANSAGRSRGTVDGGSSHDARFAAFGLPYLDNMLGGRGEQAEPDPAGGEYDTRGLISGSSTALIGDALTQKTQLANAFLSRAFYPFAKELRKRINQKTEKGFGRDLETEIKAAIREGAQQGATAENLIRDVWNKVKREAEQLAKDIDGTPVQVNGDFSITGEHHPVVVVFTTKDINVDGLADNFYQWLREEDNEPETETAGAETGSTRKLSEDEFLKQMADRVKSYAREFVEGRPTTGSFIRTYRLRQNKFRQDLIERAFESELTEYIRDHTICRRFEIHDLPSPVLMSIFQRSIEKAQRILFRRQADEQNQLPLPSAPIRARESWRIRMVIDDLNAFRNTYPEINDDPLMLPSLLFMFRREGVTSLILDTQTSSSPELPIAERFETSVRELVETRIYVWRLPFFGENRVAISVIPPISQEYRGLIRELREPGEHSTTDRALLVDPHFELYMGIEKARPRPVPLEIKLYADTPSVQKYVETEEKLLREIFTPVETNSDQTRVITPIPVHDYESLRDACHLQRDMRLNHTKLLQVNEFWWLKPPGQRRAGAFRPQWDYVNATTAKLTHDKYRKQNKYSSESVVDPFHVFQPATADSDLPKTEPPKKDAKCRYDFFDDECGYGLRKLVQHDERYIDRVPYTWDFGFLLCNAKAWNEAEAAEAVKESATKAMEMTPPKDSAPKSDNKVKAVWDKLRKASGNGEQKETVSWREFFEASKIVAEFQSFRTTSAAVPFDFTMAVPESFSCLILEMWLSESYRAIKRHKESCTDRDQVKSFEKTEKRLVDVGNRRWHPDMENPVTLLHGLEKDASQTLTEILEGRKMIRTNTQQKIQGFSLELYKVWLLLTEVIDFSDLVDAASYLNFEFKSRDVTPRAVSARHWYKSASKFFDSMTPDQVEYNWVPVRLPGHFSVRADWFLAVAGGSRSSRLADHALDLLSSKRSNVARLQEGVGLPTRILFEGDGNTSHLRTRLISAEKGKPLENVDYDSLRRIGASLNPGDEEFYWLWRSRIWAYNRHSRIWHKWLNRALLWWHSWRQRYESDWKSGFHVYELLDKIEFDHDKAAQAEFDELSLKSWTKFHELRNILIAELKQVSISNV